MKPLRNAISLFEEMLSWETLWGIRNETLKSISSQFEKHPVLPSELLRIYREERLFDDLEDLREEVRLFLRGLTGFSISVHGDFHYPQSLRLVRHPIELFYYRGDIGLTESRAISIVGTRKCSEIGAKRAEKLAQGLVEAGFTVVSGLAEGIDTHAMTAAVKAGGKTIGVIGTPINQCYPSKNASFQEHVARHHLLISQVPFYRYSIEPFQLRRRHFPERNVTMAALAQATVIVEAGETSGTMTQARACFYQGKTLFILDSCFENPALKWPVRFEKQGAIRVEDLDDILRHLTNGSNSARTVEAH